MMICQEKQMQDAHVRRFKCKRRFLVRWILHGARAKWKIMQARHVQTHTNNIRAYQETLSVMDGPEFISSQEKWKGKRNKSVYVTV